MSDQSNSKRSFLFRVVHWFVRPDHVAIFVSVGAILPYTMQLPSANPDESMLHLMFTSSMYIIGLIPWLVGHPIHLLLFLPGFLILITKIARPGPM